MSTPPLPPAALVGRHAIVCGGSISGLVTASVLSHHFERVTLVERDHSDDAPRPRKGVPQSTQLHGMHLRGMNILGNVFPGLQEELLAAGGRVLDMTESQAWCSAGAWYPRIRSGLGVGIQSRPLLEWVIRQRVQGLPNVRVLDGREVTGFQTSADRARVSGVHLRAPGGGQEETLEGELVVDASGRGSRTPQWLEALGYPRVEETRIHVDVRYATRLYQKPEGFEPGWESMALSPKLPEQRRLGVLQLIEGGRWLVTLAGWLGQGLATEDDAGFLEFARGLTQPHLHEAIKNAEPLGPIHHYRFSHNQRRHYERMPRFPEGLAVVGDASCSFNPIYGQGMTVGAMQAEALGECLRQGLGGVSQRYRQRVGKLLQVPWSMATSGDLRFPEVEGKRPPAFGLTNWYGDRLQRLTLHDEQARQTFFRVVHMLESPAVLFSPRMVFKVLTARLDTAPQHPAPEPLAARKPQSQVA
ncbi:FAD-dependent oxidoreductase [Archangium lansingense]|uniref:FAD-dependent monooxygenase n=1 Tax=Archangium lansingense TaxID=2995310 RepID=A0ABT4A750_9BACT|nr:FAD-dependent monooxygenase [Archangium lansinium]MCY1077488.1 FAD-dependent monooxygenase [Archangium lansinium]